ncbi:Pancreatic alpha-amylase [Orchesella cincta]|uniref:Alpha-amylase n=1 Tax=Orchesella cincta TaxID=48709 RepID=A0A1D2M854_ORCCI|nr:Pancreatic alpha-amylase [Orchesella cincta]
MEGGSDKNDWIGPPNQNGETLPVTILPNGTCGNGWMCEHRWRQIFNMVKFRNVVDGTNATNWWDNTENQIAFSRGNKGFTGLPAGQYCDVISGNKEGSSCTGKTITVNADGSVNLNIANTEEDPMVAIHADYQEELQWSICLNGDGKTLLWNVKDILDQAFGGVQVSPPNENAVVTTNPFRPWYERYQPVSYKLETRSGNEAQFADMVRRCNAVGVRIYVDTVINHMTGNSVYGTGTVALNLMPVVTAFQVFLTLSPISMIKYLSYRIWWSRGLSRYVALRDLNHGKTHVREKIAEYMNKLISFGVAGFRVDLAKHMWPEDLSNIFSRLNNLPTEHGFNPGTRPFIVQEITDAADNEPIKGYEYFDNGRITEFRFSIFIGEIFRKANVINCTLSRILGWGLYQDDRVLVFVDNHDNQRGHGASGQYILTFRLAKLYKMAQAFTLSWPNGQARVMSSYYWDQRFEDGVDQNDWVGPPNVDGVTSGVVIYPNQTCGGGWVCEHRWRQIVNMVSFRNVVAGTGVANWWDNNEHQIAFSRGDKGFIAINNEDSPLQATLQTGLAPGQYCDVISGMKYENSCSGKTITVNADGTVNLNISNDEEDPMIAIHHEQKL